MQYPLAQQVRIGPAIPNPLDQFYPTYLSFTLAGAPRGGQRELNCFIVLSEAPDYRLKLFQSRLGNFLAPGIKGFNVALTDDLVEPFLESVSLGEEGIGLEKGGKLLLF